MLLTLLVAILCVQPRPCVRTAKELGSICTTPNDEIAYCIPLMKCASLVRALTKPTHDTRRFIAASRCGYHYGVLVCCGTLGNYRHVDFDSLILDSLPDSHIIKELLPPRNICGRQTYSNRIYGGVKAALDEFPWMALLEYQNWYGRSMGHNCGGVLISSKYVLTAAHCITGAIERAVGKLFRVRLGEHDLRSEVDCVDENGFQDCAEEARDYYVEEAIPHPDYVKNISSIYNDIGLVRLYGEVQFTDFVAPICLPIMGERSAPGDRLFVAGWGVMENGSDSAVKLKVDLAAISNQECSSLYFPLNIYINEKHMCTIGKKGKDTCSGDSGGPLMRTLSPRSNVWYVEGIVSFGPKICAEPNIPGVYTRITEYMEWLVHSICS